jgi:hypothetical protein
MDNLLSEQYFAACYRWLCHTTSSSLSCELKWKVMRRIGKELAEALKQMSPGRHRDDLLRQIHRAVPPTPQEWADGIAQAKQRLLDAGMSEEELAKFLKRSPRPI